MKQTDQQRRRLLAATGGAVAWAGLAPMARASDASAPEPLKTPPGAEPPKPPAPAAASAASAKPAGKPLPAYASWKDADSLIVHSANTIETRRDAFGNSGITALDRLFVRNNVSPPSDSIIKDANAWALEIEGVKQPRSFTVAELKDLGAQALPMVLQCSGNGRGYFPHKPSGTQWTVGAAGCVVFAGVPVRKVLDAVGGMADGMVYMTSTGGEEIPAGIDPNTVRVERSVPIAAIEDAILAWEVNGQALPLAHGGPLRIIVPGYTGVNSVKYVRKLAFTKEQSPASIQQNSYRFSPVGVKGTAEHESIWEMPPKSWITHPLDEGGGQVQAGKVQIRGLAMGGMSAAKSVEVSVDGGQTWHPASFDGPDLGKYAWRQFVFDADLKPGTHQLACRTTNEAGQSQPEQRVENNRGYINNSWRDHMVSITVA